MANKLLHTYMSGTDILDELSQLSLIKIQQASFYFYFHYGVKDIF